MRFLPSARPIWTIRAVTALWGVWSLGWIVFAVKSASASLLSFALLCGVFAHGVHRADRWARGASATLLLWSPSSLIGLLPWVVLPGARPGLRTFIAVGLYGSYTLWLCWLGWHLRRIAEPEHRSSRSERTAVSLLLAPFHAWIVRGSALLWIAWGAFFAWTAWRSVNVPSVALALLCVAFFAGVWRMRSGFLRVSAQLFFIVFPGLIILIALNPFFARDLSASHDLSELKLYAAFWGTQLLILPWLGWHLDRARLRLRAALG